MSEPTSLAAGTLTVVAAAASTTALTLFGVPLGLRIDILFAGFMGALIAIVLLNSVPSTGDTWRELLKTTIRRVSVSFVSAFASGYLTPLALFLSSVPDSYTLPMGMLVGAGAQPVLKFMLGRLFPTQPAAAASESTT